MCGIYGEMSFSSRIDSQRVRRAATSLRHRGVDDEGYLLASIRERTATLARGDDSVGIIGEHIGQVNLDKIDVVLAFRRLAIVDLSAAGAQPMGSRDQMCWIVFNGEIYNHVELRSELMALGHSFAGNSDTEVLLASYLQWGVDCVRRFNGMWSFCILDLRRPETPLFFSRDRLGEKPLFLERSGRGIRFASEAKALVLGARGGFRPDTGAAERYLAFGSMPSAIGGETFFEGIEQLPPATCLLVGEERSQQWIYWSIPEPSLRPVSIEDAVDELRARLDDSVRLRLRADVPIGTCLSGGLDSSAIVTTMAAVGGPGFDKQHTFTAAYDIPGRHDEREHVEKILAVINAVPTMTFPSIDGLQHDMDALVWHQDEPFGSSSIYAQWCVMRAASESGVKVILDGQGADELFGGYRPFAYSIADGIRAGRAVSVRGDLSVLRTQLGMSTPRILGKALMLAAGADSLGPLRDQLSRVRSPAVLAPGVRVRRRSGRHPAGSQLDLLDAHLRKVTLETSLPELLRYEDRNAMAHGVESRTPFLDVHLVESAFGSSAGHRSLAPWTKYVLRKAAVDRVPAEIVWRKEKVGFETPEAAWRPVIQQMLAERLRNNPMADLIDARACMTAAVDDRALWRAMNLASWWNVFQKAPR